MGRFEKRKGKQEMARARELGIDLDDEEYGESREGGGQQLTLWGDGAIRK